MDLFGTDDTPVDDDNSGFFPDDLDIGSQVDRLAAQGLQEPWLSSICYSCGGQEKRLLEMFEKGHLPHALIFSGLKGVGKATFAFRFARFLFKYGKGDPSQDSLFGGDDEVFVPETMEVVPDDPVFTRVASGAYPDLLYVERGMNASNSSRKAQLDVASVRKIAPFLRKTASEGGWRVVIVEDADTMTVSAQNAILKILEEPPEKVMLVLITHRLGELIPTIRSRARVLQFNPLKPDVISDLLARQGHSYSGHDLLMISSYADGSVGRALEFAEQDGISLYYATLDLISTKPDALWPQIHDFANGFHGAGIEKKYALFTSIFLWTFRQLLFAKARGETSLPEYMDDEGLREFYLSSSLQALLKICDDLKGHFDRTDFSNLDRRETVRSAFLVISQ